jgi:hypothetical protein
VIPADGATFGRVLVSAFDEAKSLISGAYYRLRGPEQVRVFPYAKAISDWQKMQLSREFHLLSTHPGSYEMRLEVWDGTGWAPTPERFAVRFEPAGQPALAFRRTNYARRWIEPQIPRSPAAPATRLDLPLDPDSHEQTARFAIHSRLAPTIECASKVPWSNSAFSAPFSPTRERSTPPQRRCGRWRETAALKPRARSQWLWRSTSASLWKEFYRNPSVCLTILRLAGFIARAGGGVLNTPEPCTLSPSRAAWRRG